MANGNQAWFETLPADFTLEVDGKPVAARDVPFVKEAKDLPSFVKSAYDAHREVGARIPLRADNVEAWRTQHVPRLREAGLLPQVPATPKDYNITRPQDLPDSFPWSDEYATEFATILHKHGVPAAAAPDLLNLHHKVLLGVQTAFETDYDSGMETLRKEHGAAFDTRMELAKRLMPVIFKSKEEMEFAEAIGLGNHPGFLGPILRLAHLAQQDSSFMRDVVHTGGGMTPDEVRAELAKIMSDRTHPMHEGYHRGDKKVMEHIDGLYKKAYGTGTVDVSSGFDIKARPEA